MKINLKKVASVLASAVMFGSTLGFAAAAWAEPFVKNGAGDAAIVVGTSAYGTGTDYVAAVDLMNSLNADVTATGTTTVTGGDSIKLEDGDAKFNLGEKMTDFYSSGLDKENLPVVLADGTYLNQGNNDYDYEQSIVLGGNTLNFSKDSDYNSDKPGVAFFMVKTNTILNYTLDFDTDAECGTSLNDCDNTNIKMLGKEFFLSNAESTSNGVKLTLLDTANMVTLAEGDTQAIAVGDTTYNVALDIVTKGSTAATDGASFTVDGKSTGELNEGETYHIGGDAYLGIKDILVQDYAGGIKKVEFSIGMGKVVLENGQEVELNDDKVSTLKDANEVKSKIKAYITNDTTDLQSIKLEWTLNSEARIAPGLDITMPGFNAIKVSMTGFNAPGEEITTLEDSSDALVITTTIKDGALTLPILYANSTQSGFEGIGADSDEVLVTNGTSATTAYRYLSINEDNASYFVLTWIDAGKNAESYAFQFGDIDEGTNGEKNATTINNLVSGVDPTVFSEVDKEKTAGTKIKMILAAANAEDGTAVIGYKAAGSGTVYSNKLVTADGLTMNLPVNSVALGDGNINLSAANPTSWRMNFTEEDEDGNINDADASFYATLGVNADDGTEVSAITGTDCGGAATCVEEKDSDWKVGMMKTPLATKVRLYDPSGDSLGSAEIIYAGEQSSADVYVSESSATASGTTSIKVIKDSEIDSAKDKNLIVIGGSCINTVAATMLGKDVPTCGADFTALTEVAAGKYLIKVIESPYAVGTGKIAMLVAGYEAEQTTLAAAKVKEGTVSTEIGTSSILPVTAA